MPVAAFNLGGCVRTNVAETGDDHTGTGQWTMQIGDVCHTEPGGLRASFQPAELDRLTGDHFVTGRTPVELANCGCDDLHVFPGGRHIWRRHVNPSSWLSKVRSELFRVGAQQAALLPPGQPVSISDNAAFCAAERQTQRSGFQRHAACERHHGIPRGISGNLHAAFPRASKHRMLHPVGGELADRAIVHLDGKVQLDDSVWGSDHIGDRERHTGDLRCRVNTAGHNVKRGRLHIVHCSRVRTVFKVVGDPGKHDDVAKVGMIRHNSHASSLWGRVTCATWDG